MDRVGDRGRGHVGLRVADGVEGHGAVGGVLLRLDHVAGGVEELEGELVAREGAADERLGDGRRPGAGGLVRVGEGMRVFEAVVSHNSCEVAVII